MSIEDTYKITESEILAAMMASEEIHHSIADADDIEEVWDDEIRVGDVFQNLIHHPLQLITRWNWKSVVLAVVIRGLIYLSIYLISGADWAVTLTAVMVELPFRVLTTGVAGALVQSFRKSSPIWLANLIVSIMLPGFSHTVEFIAHYYTTPDVNLVTFRRTFAVSVLFSVISVLFNLNAMRKGVLLVGAGEATQSLGNDLKRIPRLIGEFVIALPMLILRFIHNRRFHYAVGTFASFGLLVGLILGAARGKSEWIWRSTLGAWGLLLFATLLTLIVRRILGHTFQTTES